MHRVVGAGVHVVAHDAVPSSDEQPPVGGPEQFRRSGTWNVGVPVSRSSRNSSVMAGSGQTSYQVRLRWIALARTTAGGITISLRTQRNSSYGLGPGITHHHT